ncbi:ABC-2 type transport system permease protein [Murinocardiopsis flavida]|uniref:ABC-2 type transport system permease protein n=1 Tax=Murinocardiopsis flavida TaxID=645275 RepID=A0A2P8DSK5_9ACTN|nr:ABC-2 family transporter protein [Murinocardiopsis flavida]PSL00175.1 ABC-2 type transport system permease protein [Murinocardiopsis flavida]
MRVLFAVFSYELRRFSTYRVATAAGVFTNSVFGVINAMVLLAVFDAKPEINGYVAEDAVLQVFVAQAMIGPVAIFGPPLDLADRIRTGEIAVDLLRPVHPLLWWLAHDLGRAAFSLAFRSAPTFTVGLLVFALPPPAAPEQWAGFAAAILLATLVGFGLRYLYAISGFWLMDTRGVHATAWLLGTFASGMVLPLVLFPDAMAQVLRLLPFAALVQVPAEILMDKATLPGGTIAGGLAYQAAWAAALIAIGTLLTARATRKVVVQGG